jgi:predicted neutral ceramidase superfamily lipid hydrolase
VESLTVLAAGGLGLAWLAERSQQTELGQAVDQAGMDLVVGDAETTRRLLGWLGVVSVGTIALAVLGLVVVAVARRRYEAAAAAVALVLGANLTTQLLKRAIEREDFGMLTVASFPSGHATVIASVSLAALLVTPTAGRTLVSALATGAVTVTAAATLVASWHRPSDVLGAILVSLVWGAALVVLWTLAHGGRPHPPPEQHRLFSLIGFVVAVTALVVLGVRPEGGWAQLLDAGLVVAAIGSAAAVAVSVFAHISTPLADEGPGGRPRGEAERTGAVDVVPPGAP